MESKWKNISIEEIDVAIKALEQNIQHWQGVRDGTIRDMGVGTDACCHTYSIKICEMCPIYMVTNLKFCEGNTGYLDWIKYSTLSDKGIGLVSDNERSLQAIDDQLMLLNDILELYKNILENKWLIHDRIHEK
jgi:hypothetical protein